MQVAGHIVGVCSWSLGDQDLATLIAQVKELGLGHMQLALGGLLGRDESSRRQAIVQLRDSGLGLTAGMIGFPGEDYTTISLIGQTGGFLPDERWPQRKQLVLDAARLAAQLRISRLSTHIGFVPLSSSDKYPVMVQRVREVAEPMAALGVELLMETGQESASSLLQFLNDVQTRNVHVNFDPANMILYGAGDPIEAIATLGRHIHHVHVKDARFSAQPGTTWGTEVPFGTGQVNPKAFLTALRQVGYTGPLSIEREAGPSRMADIRAAVEALVNNQ